MNGHRLGDLWILNVGMLLITMVMPPVLQPLFRCNAMVYANTHGDFPIATELAHCMYDQEQVSRAYCHVISDVVSHDPHRMYIFGGWVPVNPEAVDSGPNTETEWKCANNLACLNLGDMFCTTSCLCSSCMHTCQ